MTKRRNGEWLEFLAHASKAKTTRCIEGGGSARPKARSWFTGAMHASRFVWILANGDPGRLHVLHTCDNERCVNIRHLYLGTPSRNIRDAYERKRRSFKNYRMGEGVEHKAKLTERQVLDIRSRSGQTATALAREFGVSQPNISQILLGRTWKHLLPQK